MSAVADEVPSSRFRRLFALGRLGRQAIPMAWRRLRATPSDGAAETDTSHAGTEPLSDEELETVARLAEQAVQQLGRLKGLALKAGQMVSYLDGMLPERYRAVYQQAFSRLQAAAPSMPWSAVEPILRADLGRPPEELFADIDPTPFAAASIGQVHRGRLRDGSEVVLKIQYPGIDRALAADLKNATFFGTLKMPFIKTARGDPRVFAEGVWAELSARFLEELDYVREADMQERFRALVAGDPLLRVPAVHRACSGRRVLTSDFVDGRSLETVAATEPQRRRDEIGAALNRFVCRSLFDWRLLNGDPHPGNYLFPADGTVVLIDFGCVKEIPESMRAAIARYLRAAIVATRTGDAVDWAAFDDAIADVFGLDRDDASTWSLYREFVLYALRPYLGDEPSEVTAEWAGQSIDLVLGGLRSAAFSGRILPRIPRLPSPPPEFALLSRLQWGFWSVLAKLRARARWQEALPPDVRGL
jgi:predicted unusual protein kinase regulating ubiquinone biosynthesis (AarF/ABC1/UbiB family)